MVRVRVRMVRMREGAVVVLSVEEGARDYTSIIVLDYDHNDPHSIVSHLSTRP